MRFIALVIVCVGPTAMAADASEWEDHKRITPPAESSAHHVHHWHTGQHVGQGYLRKGDAKWAEHKLNPPPRGDRWLEVDNEYLLVDKNGLVLKVSW